MANSIRNILTNYGAPDEADRFVGRFLRGGLEAFMPVPPDANPPRKYSETWGACPDGYDIEILTAESIAAVELRHKNEQRPHFIENSSSHNWLNYNTFSIAEHQDEIRSCALPGFLGHDMTPVAVIIFCTQWTFPNRWIEHVINAEYERGLILHMTSYDLQSVDDGGAKVYQSYTASASVHIQSGHCAICTDIAETPVAAERVGHWEEVNPTRTEPTSDDTK
jgi:hypothetical protein